MGKKEQLREPDPFLRFTLELWDGLAAHVAQIGIGLGVLLVAAIAFVAVKAHRESARVRAGAALSNALKVADRGVEGEDTKPADGAAEADEPPFKTEKDKGEALVKALSGVRAEYPGTEAALAASVSLGDAQYKLGQYDAAAESYRAYADLAPTSDPLRALALLGVAHCAEAKGDRASAQTAYDALQREAPHTFLRDEAGLGKARMLEAQGKKVAAAEAYQQVKDGFPDGQASKAAADRLASLALQGIRPAARTGAIGADGGVPFAPAPQPVAE